MPINANNSIGSISINTPIPAANAASQPMIGTLPNTLYAACVNPAIHTMHIDTTITIANLRISQRFIPFYLLSYLCLRTYVNIHTIYLDMLLNR